VLINLEEEEFAGSFDMIYSQMVFHHVENLHALLMKLGRMLTAGGYLAIADLYTEDGSFHGEGFRGHPGFDPEWLAGQIRDAGLANIHHQWCYTITKKDASDILKEFPVFLITAEKSI
jgi:SAM-dependent methyltransferase